MPDIMSLDSVFRDGISPGLRKIVVGMDEVQAKSAKMNAVGNIFLAAGAGAVALIVKADQVAGALDQINKTMSIFEGHSKAAWDTSYIDNYAQHSYQTYMDLMKTGSRLAFAHIDIHKRLADVADFATASGMTPEEVARLYRMIEGGSGAYGYALGARGFGRIGISRKDIFAAMGIPYHGQSNFKDLGQDPDKIFDALHKILVEKGVSGTDLKLATTTLTGSFNMLKDASTRFFASLGNSNLKPTIDLFNNLATGINKVADLIKEHPTMAGYALNTAAIGGIGVGAILKGSAAYISLKNSMNLATIAAKAEQGMEGGKPALAKAEKVAVEDAAASYVKHEAATTAAADSGLVLANRFGGIIGPVSKAAKEVSVFKKAIPLAENLDGVTVGLKGMSTAAVDAGTNWGALLATDGVAGGLLGGIGAVATKMGGIGVATAAALAAWEGLHIRGHQIWAGLKDDVSAVAETMSDYANAANNNADFAIKNAFLTDAKDPSKSNYGKILAQAQKNKYEEGSIQKSIWDNKNTQIPQLRQDRSNFAWMPVIVRGIDRMIAKKEAWDTKGAGDIRALESDRKKLLASASHIPNKLKVLTKADEDKVLHPDKSSSDSKGKDPFDKVVAKLFGGGGMTDEDVLKRTGIGRHMFQSFKAHGSHSTNHAWETSLAQRMLHVHIHIGDKETSVIAKKLEDEFIKKLMLKLNAATTRNPIGVP